MPSRAIVEQFVARVVGGHHAEAIEEFYAPDASMQENGQPPRTGRDTLVANERAVLARAKRVGTRCFEPVMIDGDHVVIHWLFEFEWRDGTSTRIEELALQRWSGERIVEERFFYDAAQMRPARGTAGG